MAGREVWGCEGAKILDFVWSLFCLRCLQVIQVEMREETTGRGSQRFEILLNTIKCLVSDISWKYSNSISLIITSSILESSPVYS